jgi:hypothetical protein
MTVSFHSGRMINIASRRAYYSSSARAGNAGNPWELKIVPIHLAIVDAPEAGRQAAPDFNDHTLRVARREGLSAAIELPCGQDRNELLLR